MLEKIMTQGKNMQSWFPKTMADLENLIKKVASKESQKRALEWKQEREEQAKAIQEAEKKQEQHEKHTNATIEGFKGIVCGEIANAKGELRQDIHQTNERISSLEVSMEKRFSEVKEELSNKIDQKLSEVNGILRWLFVFMVGTLLTSIGTVVAIFAYFK
jgi:Fe2+ transport system protein B